jgi:hypothetical protein
MLDPWRNAVTENIYSRKENASDIPRRKEGSGLHEASDKIIAAP